MDPDEIRSHLPSVKERYNIAENFTRQHLENHQGYVSWSGGKDSTVVVHLATRTHPETPIVWFNSGLEYPDNIEYIHRIAHLWDLNFHVIDAEPDALTIMRQAGTWSHEDQINWETPDLHTHLITIPAQKARQRYGKAELWGLRAQESVGRKNLLVPRKGKFVRQDGTITYSPIWSWKTTDIYSYFKHYRIPENPVYTKLAAAGASQQDLRVGLAVDGNNLHHGRITWLKRTYPELYQKIEQNLPRIREWS